jgi:hypothetical protein
LAIQSSLEVGHAPLAEVNELSSLRSKILSSLEGILILALSAVQERNSYRYFSNDRSSTERHSCMLSYALDYTRIEVLVSQIMFDECTFCFSN